jgi:hypothetical protein
MWWARLSCGEHVSVTRSISRTRGPWGRLRRTSICELARPVRELLTHGTGDAGSARRERVRKPA